MCYNGWMTTCSVPPCLKPSRSLGMCPMHYTRLRRHGSVEGKIPQGDPFDRLMAKVAVQEGGCWVFTGKSTKNGYAVVGDGRHGWHYGHRLAYQRLVGQIPDKHRLHHTCEVPPCVNPDHLHPTTARDHAIEHGLGIGPCVKCGADDWYIRVDNGTRQCRECRRIRRGAEAAGRR